MGSFFEENWEWDNAAPSTSAAASSGGRTFDRVRVVRRTAKPKAGASAAAGSAAGAPASATDDSLVLLYSSDGKSEDNKPKTVVMSGVCVCGMLYM
jgi:hypothetical protein